MPEIFLSYRRADAAGTAGRLFDRLSRHFGAEQVFRDIDSIEAGDDFELSIHDALRTAAAVLVVIGPRWLDLRRENGTRRLDDPLDYVRREIEIALSSDAIVIPVLVETAVVPPAELLPTSIRELSKRNAVELTNRRWESDIEDFIRQLEIRGIPVVEQRGSERVATQTASHGRAATSALAGFFPNLFSLLYQPRRFLSRRTQGHAADLTGAFAFFMVAVLLAVAILISVYTPEHSVVSFGLAVSSMGMLVTAALSVILWVAWRLVGATRLYSRLLVVLLHQMAVLHLAVFVMMSIVLFGLELQSQNVAHEIMQELMKPGRSASVALESIRYKFESLVDASEVRIALGLGGVVLLAGVVWIVRSWGAYRDAFGLSRARAIAAVGVSVLVAWAGLTLISLLA